MWDYQKVVKLLLDRGADPNQEGLAERLLGVIVSLTATKCNTHFWLMEFCQLQRTLLASLTFLPILLAILFFFRTCAYYKILIWNDADQLELIQYIVQRRPGFFLFLSAVASVFAYGRPCPGPASSGWYLFRFQCLPSQMVHFECPQGTKVSESHPYLGHFPFSSLFSTKI